MLLAAAAALTGAVAQSATGFGFALILSPALFAALEPYEAVSALLVLGLALNLLVLADVGRVRWPMLLPALLAAAPGLAVGVLVLEALSKPALQVGVGTAVLLAALWQLAGRPVHVRDASVPAACAAGLASGALTTSISVSGPPLVLWLESRGVSPGELRATLAAAFLVLNLAGMAALVAAGGGDLAGPGVVAPLMALVIAGHVVGALAFRRLAGPRFRTIVLLLVAAAGAASVAAGLAGA